ncbi:hypothetical protein CEN50_14105 [Fischerella thermalis CCMEE 5268]|uniref:Uncharacterized protein n=1 Tax=Fischerella thermalis CCMEE 5268 TaxID=2019662 RepID=A0A2N6KF21_9CYAN|nr:hypothetical protein CEN50_14105 [Fischerella thermalis CCMEE 5268]
MRRDKAEGNSIDKLRDFKQGHLLFPLWKSHRWKEASREIKRSFYPFDKYIFNITAFCLLSSAFIG